MGTTLAVARREFRSFFNSPVAYIVIGVFLVVAGWLYFSTVFVAGQASLRAFFSIAPVLFVVFAPATGLADAHDTLEAQLKDGKKVVVHLGRQPEAKEGSATVAARVEGDAQVYQLSQHVASRLRKRLVDLAQ